MKKQKLGRVEGEIFLWSPFVVALGSIILFSFIGWGGGGILIVFALLLGALLNARILLFGKD